jgi:XTP/dITP diphosphohydrolase
MRDIENRKARFQSVITYLSAKTESPICFGGEVAGEIVEEERRKDRESGFGFDPIFKPVNSARTFAEMDTAEKNKCSHRARALRKFAEWYGKLP